MPACTLSVEIPSGGVAEIPDFTGELTATDNRTPLHLLIIEQDPPAGTLVGVGAYIITTTITDQSGNTTTCTNVFCVTAEAGVGPFLNTAQSFTAVCPDGTTGTSKTAVIPAGTYSSNVSQADADSQALTAAAAQANAALCCCPIGEECEECPDNVYPYGFGYENFYELYDYPFCYPYGYGCPELPVIPSTAIDHWWKMEESASNTRRDSIDAMDLAPSVISGTIGNAAGKVNLACRQTGSNVTLQTGEGPYNNLGFTLFGWVFVTNDAFSSILLDYQLGVGINIIRLNFNQDLTGTTNTAVLSEAVGGTVVVPSIDITSLLGTWIFFRAWHLGSNGALRLQLNNGSIFESPTNWTPAAHLSTSLFFYGTTDPRLFDEIGLIHRVLTAAEASYIYNGGAGRTWPFA